MRRTSRLKIAKCPRRKKENTELEIVTHCDWCGAKLVSTRIRTAGSAICSAGCGNPAENIDGKWRFFCSGKCNEANKTSRPGNATSSSIGFFTETGRTASAR